MREALSWRRRNKARGGGSRPRGRASRRGPDTLFPGAHFSLKSKIDRQDHSHTTPARFYFRVSPRWYCVIFHIFKRPLSLLPPPPPSHCCEHWTCSPLGMPP